MTQQPVSKQRGIEEIASSIASAIRSTADHLTRPTKDPIFQFLEEAAPIVPYLIEMMKPPKLVDAAGPSVRQVRRELAAEEARLSAEHAEKRARLVADFGPRFDKAQRMDEIDLITRESADKGRAE